jgi:plasmid rolling circle replication initiator protein Rep
MSYVFNSSLKFNKNQVEHSAVNDEYKNKKILNKKFVEFGGVTNVMTNKTIERVETCSDYMKFLETLNHDERKCVQAFRCGKRGCPICDFARSRKDSGKISVVMQHLKNEYDYEFLFLTLTARNVSADNLNQEIKDYSDSYKRLIETKEVKQMMKGSVRKLEVTYNAEDDTYHPHLHIIIAVNKSYFTDRTYIKQQRWLELWRRSKRDESITQVHIQKLKENAGKEVHEIAKYSAKHSDMLENEDVFYTLFTSLKGKRLLTYQGKFKEVAKMYDQDLLDDLIEKDETNYVWQVEYLWNSNSTQYDQIKQLSLDEMGVIDDE